jgi:hypothetical protein
MGIVNEIPPATGAPNHDVSGGPSHLPDSPRNNQQGNAPHDEAPSDRGRHRHPEGQEITEGPTKIRTDLPRHRHHNPTRRIEPLERVKISSIEGVDEPLDKGNGRAMNISHDSRSITRTPRRPADGACHSSQMSVSVHGCAVTVSATGGFTPLGVPHPA